MIVFTRRTYSAPLPLTTNPSSFLPSTSAAAAAAAAVAGTSSGTGEVSGTAAAMELSPFGGAFKAYQSSAGQSAAAAAATEAAHAQNVRLQIRSSGSGAMHRQSKDKSSEKKSPNASAVSTFIHLIVWIVTLLWFFSFTSASNLGKMKREIPYKSNYRALNGT